MARDCGRHPHKSQLLYNEAIDGQWDAPAYPQFKKLYIWYEIRYDVGWFVLKFI